MSPFHAGAFASTVIALNDSSQVGEARRAAVALAQEIGLEERTRSDVGIVATEAANNVLHHGGRGAILLRWLGEEGDPGLELLCLDGGPGMHDVDACLADGYSTAGTLGAGLGAMRRLAHGFAIYSGPAHGTAVACRFWRGPRVQSERPAPLVGGLAAARLGETTCGDAWAAHVGRAGISVLIADGLGHGPAAAEASSTAAESFRADPARDPATMLQRLHDVLRTTRGAAVAVGFIDPERREVRFAGVGNIGAALVTDTERRGLISYNGTVGLEARKILEIAYPWPPGALLVVHSDGLAAQWRLDRYPGLLQRDPALVAGVLYRDFARPRDDVTVVVCRMPVLR